MVTDRQINCFAPVPVFIPVFTLFLTVDLGRSVQREVDFLYKSVVKNIIPVESVMCKRRVFALALLKGMEVKLNSPNGGSLSRNGNSDDCIA
jgi:hypothetical protein